MGNRSAVLILRDVLIDLASTKIAGGADYVIHGFLHIRHFHAERGRLPRGEGIGTLQRHLDVDLAVQRVGGVLRTGDVAGNDLSDLVDRSVDRRPGDAGDVKGDGRALVGRVLLVELGGDDAGIGARRVSRIVAKAVGTSAAASCSVSLCRACTLATEMSCTITPRLAVVTFCVSGLSLFSWPSISPELRTEASSASALSEGALSVIVPVD